MKKIVLLFLLFAAACGPSTESMSILDRSSCDLPCWNGIVAGQTTEAELLQILENSPNILEASVNNENRPRYIFDNRILFSFGRRHPLSGRSKLRGYAYITRGTLSQLIICGKIETSMGRLAEEIGGPDHIISGNNISGGRTVILIDSRTGVSYWYTTSLDKLEITPDTEIDCVQIFDVSLYEKMLEAKIFSDGYYNAAETQKAWYAWDGYGNLDEKYPPRQP